MSELYTIQLTWNDRFVDNYACCSKLIYVCFSESTPEGRRITKLEQILLNGNNITMVSFLTKKYSRLCAKYIFIASTKQF